MLKYAVGLSTANNLTIQYISRYRDNAYHDTYELQDMSIIYIL